jgi:hypothetical protein
VKRGRGLLALAGSAACVLAALFAVAALSPSRKAGPCTVMNEPALLRDVPEASGLAVGRGRPTILWTHNDSGNATDLFAISADGAIQGRMPLPFRTRDWEDISAAPCPRRDGDPDRPGNCLYVGDIGDNEMARKSVRVYVVPELTPGTALTAAGRQLIFTVTYPDGAHNAEAMFVAGRYLFIVTKDRTGIVYRSTSPLADGDVTMRRVTQLELTGVTDAEASADEESVAVRTSDEVVIYRTVDLMDSGKVPQGVRIAVGGLREPQGEGVALGQDGTLYLTSEGRPWNRAGRLIALRCTFEKPT